MAFHPFRAFRKHQKVILAGVTILAMITFVMVAPGMDLVTQFLRFFGGTSHTPVAASLYGKDIHLEELQKVRNQRQVAAIYMDNALQLAQGKLQGKNQEIVMTLMTKYPDLAQQIQFQGIEGTIQQLQAQKKTEEVEVLRQFVDLRRQATQMAAVKNRESSLNGPSRFGAKDLLDYTIWLHQADRLGIQLTLDDINKLVSADTQNLLSLTQYKQIDSFLKSKFAHLTNADIQAALGDYFRVRMAQEALLGSSGGEAVTPYELWQSYREKRTQGTVALLPIPVRSPEFLAQVAKMPPSTAEELKALYEKYKDKEYAPDSDTPGFKQPPRIQVEWVRARPDSPYYLQEAAKVAAGTQAALQALGGARAGATPVDGLLPLAIDTKLLSQYEVLKESEFRVASWSDPNLAVAFYADRNRAENVAATVGESLATAATQGPAAVAGLISYEGGSKARLDKEAGPVTSLLGGPNSVFLTAASLWSYADPKEQYLPMEAVRARLVEKEQKDLAQKLVRTDLESLRQDLETLNKLRTPEEVRQYLKETRPQTIAATFGLMAASAGSGVLEFPIPMILTDGTAADPVFSNDAWDAAAAVLAGATPFPFAATSLVSGQEFAALPLIQARLDRALAKGGLELGISKTFRDAFTIDDTSQDPALQTLKETYLSSPDTKFQDPKGRQFPSLFFEKSAQPVKSDPYDPQKLPKFGDETILYWNSAIKPAYVPTYEEIAARVRAQWEFEKARPLAQAAADELAGQARKAGGDPMKNLADAGKRFGEDLAFLPDVTPVVPDPQTGNGFKPYAAADIKNDKIEYPSDEMAAKLLTMKDKGDVVVVADKPGATYYVATLLARIEPKWNAFYGDYGSFLTFFERDPQYLARRRETVLDQLRAEAKLTINENNLKDYDKRGAAEEEE